LHAIAAITHYCSEGDGGAVDGTVGGGTVGGGGGVKVVVGSI
jgi:hypothetical protein